MPELPEVEMARRYLQATSLLQTIRAAEVKDGRILAGVSATQFEQALAGKQFHCAMRHGKRLFLKLHDSLWLALHLGLTGRLIYLESGAEEPSHTRLLISFENGRSLAFDDPRIFGEVGLAKSPQAFLVERKIGPNALQLDPDGFLKIMKGRKGLIKPIWKNCPIPISCPIAISREHARVMVLFSAAKRSAGGPATIARCIRKWKKVKDK